MLPFDRKYFVDLVYKRSTAFLTSVSLTEAVTGSTQSVSVSRVNGLFRYILDSVQIRNLKSEIEISEIAGPWFLEGTLISKYLQKLSIASLRYLVINNPILSMRYLFINYPILPLRSRTQCHFCPRSETYFASLVHETVLSTC